MTISSGLPSFSAESTTKNVSWSILVIFLNPGNSSNAWLTPPESGLIKLYKTLKSDDAGLKALSKIFNEVAGFFNVTVFDTYIAACGSLIIESTLLSVL